MSNKSNPGLQLNSLFQVMQEELNDKVVQEPERAFAIDRQVQRMRKRAALSNGDLKPKAIADFISNNDLVGTSNVTLAEDLVVEASRFINYSLERFTTSFNSDNIQESLDPVILLEYWRFGPGSSNGIRGTHVAEKIEQEMTCTVLARPFVKALRKSSPYFQLNDERNGNDGVVVVDGSRLATVPKNEDTERTIAIEPSGNMALQLAAGSYIEATLRMIGLDIRTQQPKNKAMARRGSIDGSIATIDLKSASDMISIELVRKLWPARWFSFLTSIRSGLMEISSGKSVQLNMISTMGNGFTFPLMTMTLVALIYAYRRLRGGPNLYIDWSNTCVFGDDIIVPSQEYDTCCDVLVASGLIVNYEKSFAGGDFRESCGGDYYKGYDVTPFYVKSVHDNAACYVAINQILEWCARNNLLLHRTLGLVKSFIRGRVFLVPEWHNPDQGILTTQVSARYSYLSIVPPRVLLKGSNYEMMLVCGGFINAGESDMYYSPRPYKMRSVVRHARLPKGYLSGVDPIKRSAHVSQYIAAYSFLFE